jgi:hypothetical protein
MAGQQPASVPLEPVPLPKQIYQDGLRLDGRGNEEFRSICESLVAASYIAFAVPVATHP